MGTDFYQNSQHMTAVFSLYSAWMKQQLPWLHNDTLGCVTSISHVCLFVCLFFIISLFSISLIQNFQILNWVHVGSGGFLERNQHISWISHDQITAIIG